MQTLNIDTLAAKAELATVDVGLIYNDFQAAGGFMTGTDPRIPGTSWSFITDGNQNDLQLRILTPEVPTTYIRCVRKQGCSVFHGDSNPVILYPEILSEASYEICNNILSISGLEYGAYYFFKAYTPNYSSIVVECNSFVPDCDAALNIELPDGAYIIDIMLVDEFFIETQRITEYINLPMTCATPLVAATSPESVEARIERAPEQAPVADREEQAEEEVELLTFPNPANKFVTISSKAIQNKDVRVKVFSSVGQLLIDQKYDALRSDQIELDVSQFQTGIYFVLLQVKAEREMITRFVVNRVDSK